MHGDGALSAETSFTDRLDTRIAGVLAYLSGRPGIAALALVALVLVLHLPGMLVLPPVDRTEVMYAQTAKQILEEGRWTSPRFQADAQFEKPLVVLWLQAASARLFGATDQIWGYRLPALGGTLLAVLFTFLGGRRLFGANVALIGAALLATMLVVTVQATLAMPESLMLAATCAALWSMARVYGNRDGGSDWPAALTFWSALGLGFLANVFTVALIALIVAASLIAWERGRAEWLWRLKPLFGIPLFLGIASLWPLALHLGGTLDAAIAEWRAGGLHLLLGPQEMKWRVVPGLFLLFLFLGLFPAGLFLAPAVIDGLRQWMDRRIAFLVAWAVPYVVLLELLSRKTPLYMVQAALPPLAVLFAVWIDGDRASSADHDARWFRFGAHGWLALVVVLVVAMWLLPFLLKLWVHPLAVALGLAALAAAYVATRAITSGHRYAAATALVAMGLAFNTLTLPVTLAGLRPVWVSSEIRAAVDALRKCAPGDVLVVGHTEPSVVFELGTATVRSGDGARSAELFGTRGGLAVVAEAQADAFLNHAHAPPANVGCVAAYDFIKSCSHRFGVYSSTPEAYASCPLPERFSCRAVLKQPIIGRLCK